MTAIAQRSRASRVETVLLAAVALLSSLDSAATVASIAEETPLEKGLAATVLVKVRRLYRAGGLPASGSGFFVGPNGLVVTSAYLVVPRVELDATGRQTEESKLLGVIDVVVGAGTAGERTLSADLLSFDHDSGLALLAVPYPSVSFLDLAESPVRIGDPVWVLGFPFGELLSFGRGAPEVTAVPGHVSSVRHDEKGAEGAVQVDATINPGSSGGPMLDRDGRVAGVALVGIATANATALAIPLDKLRDFLLHNQVHVTVEPPEVIGRIPLRVRVIPVALPLVVAKADCVLSGGDIPDVSASLASSNGAFEGTLELPARDPSKSRPASYRLAVRLRDATSTLVHENVLELPVRGGEPQVLVEPTPSPPATRRAPDGSRADEPAAEPARLRARPATATERANSPLADVASRLRLKTGGSATPVITNDSLLDECASRLRPEHYEKLPKQDLRALAAQLDYALCKYYELERMVQDFQRVGGEVTRSRLVWEGDRPAVETTTYRLDRSAVDEFQIDLGLELQSLAKQLRAAEACHCNDGRWLVPPLAASCRVCVTPEPPRAPDQPNQ